jgi:hypothetical protein
VATQVKLWLGVGNFKQRVRVVTLRFTLRTEVEITRVTRILNVKDRTGIAIGALRVRMNKLLKLRV